MGVFLGVWRVKRVSEGREGWKGWLERVGEGLPRGPSRLTTQSLHPPKSRAPEKKVIDAVRRGKQAMVFVHSRKDTGKTARALVDLARSAGELGMFDAREDPQYALIAKQARFRAYGDLGFLGCLGLLGVG